MKYKYLFNGKKISTFGYGLYKGEVSKKGDDQLLDSVLYGIKKGINVIDTAQRYRNGRSEKLIKQILKKYKKRKNLIIVSKAGLIPRYIKERKILKKLNIRSSNCLLENDFCIDPIYISWSVDNSLKLMNTEYIDFYLLHNPEISLMMKDGYRKIIEACKILELKRKEKKISNYGISTWNGFRRQNNNKFQINISNLLDDLKKEIGEDHGFKCIEAPVSLGMPDLLNYKPVKGFKLETFLKKNKIDFFSSASLYEGNLEKLIQLNKIFNSIDDKKDMTNEMHKADVSFPFSENSLRRLFILLENFKKNKILLGNLKNNLKNSTNIHGVAISFLKTLLFISTSLIGMDNKKFARNNLYEFNQNLSQKKIIYINKVWKKIQSNL